MNQFTVIVDRNRKKLLISDNTIHLPFQKEGDLWSDLQSVAKKASLDGLLTKEVLDLLDLSTAIFHLDKLCLRKEREQWSRNITLRISLRNTAQFKLIEAKLKLALSILGGDNFIFEVEPFTDTNIPRFPLINKKVKKWGALTDIALLSGGQDSLVGAAFLLSKRLNPIFVRVNTRDKSNLSLLSTQLKNKFDKNVILYSQTATSFKIRKKETSQRLRSFYFLCTSSAIANSHRVTRLHINENGIMAIHLPLDPARASTFSTRTAYPFFLNIFEKIINEWLGSDLKIINSFELKTKTEVVKLGESLGISSLFKNTVSCAHSATIQQTVKNQKSNKHLMRKEAKDLHCGYCFPCILRRISMFNAGLSEYDIEYATDPFLVFADGSSNDYQFVYEATSAVIGLIRLTLKFEEPNLRLLLSDYPQIAECAMSIRGGDMNNIITLHQNFSNEVQLFINEKAPYLSFLFNYKKSEELEQRILSISPENLIDQEITHRKIKATDSFYKQMVNLFNDHRFRTQIALANETIDESKIRKMLSTELDKLVKRKGISAELTIQDAATIKKGFWEKLTSQPCPPFWE